MFMKKIISIALTILMVFVFASCSSESTEQNDKAAATNNAEVSAQTQEDADDGEIVTLVIEQLRAGNLSEAQTYNQMLPETAPDDTTGTLTDEMKSAYKDIVENADAFTDYWLCDVDNDGNAELLLNLGPDSASAMTRIYKYEDGKATEVGEINGNVTCHAYPDNNGIITELGKQGLNILSLVTLENGQVAEEELVSHEAAPDEEYFNMRNRLKSHAEWSDDKYVPIFDDLEI